MSFLTITSQLFNCVDRSDPQTTWLDGCIGDRYRCVTSFRFQKGTSASIALSFSGGVITALPGGDAGQIPPTENFINDGFQIGETIKMPGSLLNTGSFTITSVTATTLTVTGIMVSESCVSYIYVTSLITSLDFLYNLLPVNSAVQFNSLTDSGTQQKYTVSGIAANVSTPVYFTIGTKSYAWVTDTVTGSTSQAFIIGTGITGATNSPNDYEQSFTITHFFTITPLALSNWLRNFTQNNPPTIYPLAYATGLNGYYTSGTPNIIASYSGIGTGTVCFVDQNNQGTVPEFSVAFIAYVDNASGSALDALDFTKNNLVAITLTSKSGLFVNNTTKIVLSHIYIPLSATDYQGTSSTLRQNFMNDKAVQTLGNSAVNGEFYGGNYSVFQNVVSTFVNSNTITVTCSAIYAAYLQQFLTGKQTTNRNYALLVSIETSGNRVQVLCDCQNMGYDQRNSALLAFTDNFHFYPYPQLSGKGSGSCSGFEGDPFYVKIPFRVETNPVNGIAPILSKIVVSVVAIKPNENDFIVESKTFNTSNFCLNKGVPQINITGTRGYITYPNDPFNIVSLKNDSSKSVGTMAGYMLQYAFVLRYDYWNPITTTSPISSDCGTDISNYIPDVTNAWSYLAQNGWDLVLRFQGDVIGYDGYTTSFIAQQSLEIKPLGSKSDIPLQYNPQTIYYDDSEVVGTIISEIKKGSITRIRTIWTPNGFPTKGYGNFFGSIFIDLPTTGGVYTRRFASSEIPSETGSPFSATSNLNPIGTDTMDQYSHGNLRIGWYKRGALLGTVITETNYNDAGINWSNTTAPVPVVKLGFQPAPAVIADTKGNVIIDSNGNEILAY